IEGLASERSPGGRVFDRDSVVIRPPDNLARCVHERVKSRFALACNCPGVFGHGESCCGIPKCTRPIRYATGHYQRCERDTAHEGLQGQKTVYQRFVREWAPQASDRSPYGKSRSDRSSRGSTSKLESNGRPHEKNEED